MNEWGSECVSRARGVSEPGCQGGSAGLSAQGSGAGHLCPPSQLRGGGDHAARWIRKTGAGDQGAACGGEGARAGCHPLLRATGPGLARAAPLPPSPRSLPASPCTVGRGHREWGRGRLWHHRAGRPSWSSGSAGPSPRPLRPSAARCPGRHEAAVFVRGHVLRGRARGGGAGAGGARPDSPLPAPPRPLTCWARTPHPQTGKGEQGGGRGGGMDGHLGRRMGTLRTDGDT